MELAYILADCNKLR